MGNKASGDERGASLVELAFALPLLIMLLVGMVSAGIAYNHQLALTHAAREGGRYAATLPVDGDMPAWLATVRDQVVADATGSLDDGVSGRYVCVAYVHPHGHTLSPSPPDDRTTRLELFEDGSTNSDSGQCFDGGDGRPAEERRVQVVVQRNTDFSVVFWSTSLTLSAEAVHRFEAALGG